MNMLSSSQYHLLQLARDNLLPDAIDDASAYSVADLRMLVDLGLMRAIDVGADSGDGFLRPRITGLGVVCLNSRPS